MSFYDADLRALVNMLGYLVYFFVFVFSAKRLNHRS